MQKILVGTQVCMGQNFKSNVNLSENNTDLGLNEERELTFLLICLFIYFMVVLYYRSIEMDTIIQTKTGNLSHVLDIYITENPTFNFMICFIRIKH